MYTVDRKVGNLSGAIRHFVDGEERPADLHAEYVQTFASAVSDAGNRKLKGNPWLPPTHVLFETRDELVRYCKDHVVKLVVRHEDSGRDALAHARSAERPLGTGRIFNLPTALAPWPGSAAEGVVDMEAMLCVGDGFIFVFRSSLHATYFAAHLAALIEMLVARELVPVEIHFRMGVHAGPVYCFWDLGRNDWNYIGEGINGAQRVLSVIGRKTDDVVFISSRVRQDLLASSGEESMARLILSNAQNKGRRHDKHGVPWRTYEVNHTDLMSDDVRSLRGIAPES